MQQNSDCHHIQSLQDLPTNYHYSNSLDRLRHTRSVAYSGQLVVLNKQQISVSGQFRCARLDCAILTPNSQICVALMVSAPIYVVQKQMSY